MRKNIMVAVGLALSIAGVASAQQGERGERPRRGAAGEMRDTTARRGGPRGGPDGFLLRGITLTEGQRAQIAQLNKTQRDAFEAKHESRRTEIEQVRAARQRGDTAAVRAAMQKNRQEMVQARAQHAAAIRNLLTAEQRVQFDKNVAELQQRESERGRLGDRGDKAGRGHGKGEKPFRGKGGR